MTKNPNDNSAAFYDFVNQPLKNIDVLNAEVKLIKLLTPNGGSILDIGCGTGRHIIRLIKDGYEVKGVDSSIEMINALIGKNSSIDAEIIDVYCFVPQKEYDTIVLMWNTFNELALEEIQAEKLIGIIKKSLKKKGKVLINIDDSAKLNLPKIDFKTIYEEKGYKYEQKWKVIDFNRMENVTISREIVNVYDPEGKLVFESESDIKQRWWSREELRELLEKQGFEVKFRELEISGELYCVGEK